MTTTKNNPKIIQKSIEIAKSIPVAGKPHHFAFGYHRNKLLAIGTNSYDETSSVNYFNRKFGTEYYAIHAELDLIKKLWGKIHIDKSLKVVILRTNRFGQLRISKPCSNCQTLLDGLGINKIWYSDSQGNIVEQS